MGGVRFPNSPITVTLWARANRRRGPTSYAPKMAETRDYGALLVRHLEFIDKMARIFSRRDGLSADEADDFTSWVHERLIEDDYAVFRKFRGDSALTTYLTIVISRLQHDYRVSQWGRWRPSAEALRKGRDAVALEKLVYRDRHTIREAVEILRTRGSQSSARDLFALFSSLPGTTRGRPKAVGDVALEHTADVAETDRPMLAAEAEAERSRMQEALKRIVAALPHEDAVIIRMRFLEGLSVAEIARTRGLDQKPLYRRIERTLTQLRGELEAAGFSRDSILEMLNELKNVS